MWSIAPAERKTAATVHQVLRLIMLEAVSRKQKGEVWSFTKPKAPSENRWEIHLPGLGLSWGVMLVGLLWLLPLARWHLVCFASRLFLGDWHPVCFGLDNRILAGGWSQVVRESRIKDSEIVTILCWPLLRLLKCVPSKNKWHQIYKVQACCKCKQLKFRQY